MEGREEIKEERNEGRQLTRPGNVLERQTSISESSNIPLFVYHRPNVVKVGEFFGCAQQKVMLQSQHVSIGYLKCYSAEFKSVKKHWQSQICCFRNVQSH